MTYVDLEEICMPKLDWIGKNAVVRHHLDVPYRLLHCNGRLSAGDSDSDNLLVQGDNLEALRTLLPYYAGKVKCIYIDPPYNTGKKGWKYNDKVNSPKIKKWLKKVVGEDDLCRHDKWLCMMYPRLRLLREFLSKDGVVFVSIDDNEHHHLRMLMDEIFGSNNIVAQISWQGMDTTKSDVTHFSKNCEYILCYAKDKEILSIAGVQKTAELRKKYKNRDNDPRGDYLLTPLHAKSGKDESIYTFVFPNGQEWTPPKGRYPLHSEDVLQELIKDGRIYLGPDGENVPQKKTFWNETSDTMPPPTFWTDDKFSSFWAYKQFGSTRNANAELREIIGRGMFDNPKPTMLIRAILKIIDDENALIMDSFAGSGTTAHAVLQQNKEDGGNRKFILVEMEKEISENITAKRIQKAIEGYEYEKLVKKEKVKEEVKEIVVPLGGGFRFCTLGSPLFDKYGNVNSEVKFSDLAAHVFFSETGMPIPKRATTRLLGEYQGDAIYLLFNGIMGDEGKDGNVLTTKTLAQLPDPKNKNARHIIYGEACVLSPSDLQENNIIFRQIPYSIHKR